MIKKLAVAQKFIYKKIISMNRIFLITVFIPTVISSLYYCFIASDVYISESRFVVRSPQKQSSTGLGSLLTGAGFSKSQDDTYTVRDYIESRDALSGLEKRLGTKKLFGDKNIDLFNRFAPFEFNESFEDLYQYYLKHIELSLESQSSILTLKTRAFSAGDARAINEALLEQSEALVNRLNERAREDMLQFATQQVELAQHKAQTAAMRVAQFRNSKGVIDPEKQSSIQLQQISKIQDDLLSTEAQIAQLKSLTRDNPQIEVLQKRADILRSAIATEKSHVAGNGEASLAGKAAEYQEVNLQREFADRQLASALSSLEQARNEAIQKQLYLERIAQPSTPDKALEPKRIHGVLATLAAGLLAWGILTLLFSAIAEHRD